MLTLCAPFTSPNNGLHLTEGGKLGHKVFKIAHSFPLKVLKIWTVMHFTRFEINRFLSIYLVVHCIPIPKPLVGNLKDAGKFSLYFLYLNLMRVTGLWTRLFLQVGHMKSIMWRAQRIICRMWEGVGVRKRTKKSKQCGLSTAFDKTLIYVTTSDLQGVYPDAISIFNVNIIFWYLTVSVNIF